MMELERQEEHAEIGRCHICALTFAPQEDVSKHLKEAHGGKEAEQHGTPVRKKAFQTAPNPVEQNQTLLEELVWSVVLIGGVVAYLVLVVQFAS
jgi:uncharacterized C2H2 Zn-finger protein